MVADLHASRTTGGVATYFVLWHDTIHFGGRLPFIDSGAQVI